MVLYTLVRKDRKILEVVVPEEEKSDRCRIPYRIYKAAHGRWWNPRPSNEIITVYRGTDVVDNGRVLNLTSPEILYKHYVKYSLEREKRLFNKKLKTNYSSFLSDQRIL